MDVYECLNCRDERGLVENCPICMGSGMVEPDDSVEVSDDIRNGGEPDG